MAISTVPWRLCRGISAATFPHWDPPPRIGYGEQHPPIVEVFEACLANDTKPWVAGLCLRKFEQTGYADGAHAYGNRMDSDRFDRFLELLERLPDDSSVVADFEEALAAQLGDQSSRTELQRARVRALLPDNR